jgi:hypothetical protein
MGKRTQLINTVRRARGESTSNVRSKIMAAKFELYRSSNGEYRWRLRATNGQVIGTGGEGYSSRLPRRLGLNR